MSLRIVLHGSYSGEDATKPRISAAIPSAACPMRSDQPIERASAPIASVHHQNNTETYLAAVHSFVSLGYAAQGIFFDHWMHTGERTEFQRVLRISRCAGITAGH